MGEMEAQDAAFQALAQALGAQARRINQPAPFQGGPSTDEWRLAWDVGEATARLVAAATTMDGQGTQSTWLSIESRALDPAAWLRVATRPLEEACLGARLAHRRGFFGDERLEEDFVLGLPPGAKEAAALYGPTDRDYETSIRATDAFFERLRPSFLEVLPRLRSLGDFVIEVEDGTLSVRYPLLLRTTDAYRGVIACAQRLVDSAGVRGTARE